jgi:hypothetical protein
MAPGFRPGAGRLDSALTTSDRQETAITPGNGSMAFDPFRVEKLLPAISRSRPHRSGREGGSLRRIKRILEGER